MCTLLPDPEAEVEVFAVDVDGDPSLRTRMAPRLVIGCLNPSSCLCGARQICMGPKRTTSSSLERRSGVGGSPRVASSYVGGGP